MTNDTEALRFSGECRNVVGIWGDRSCPELRSLDHCYNCPVYTALGRRVLDREVSEAFQDSINWSEYALADAPVMQTKSLLVFRLGADWFCLSTERVREIVPPSAVHPVPHRLKKGFQGLVNVRGEVHPCVDLRVLLGCGPAAKEKGIPRMILILDQGACYAFLADEVDNLLAVDVDSISSPPVSVEKAVPCYTSGMVRWAGKDLAILDEDLLMYSLSDLCQ